MYDTPHTIIRAAIAADKDGMRKRLIDQAETHEDYSQLARDSGAKRGAIASRDACLRAYDLVDTLSVDQICASTGTMVITLNVACKMLGLSAAVRTAAAIAFPRLIESTERADYYQMGPERFQAFKPGQPPIDNGAGYFTLQAVKNLKGDK